MVLRVLTGSQMLYVARVRGKLMPEMEPNLGVCHLGDWTACLGRLPGGGEFSTVFGERKVQFEVWVCPPHSLCPSFVPSVCTLSLRQCVWRQHGCSMSSILGPHSVQLEWVYPGVMQAQLAPLHSVYPIGL